MDNNITLLVIVIIVAIGAYYRYSSTGETTKLPYKKKDFLLNIPERKFYEKVKEIVPPGYIILPQVLLSNIVSVKSSRKTFRKRQNKINKKTIDFVIFEKQYLKPVGAIEYDGSTHKRKDRKERDLFVNSVLSSAHIPILHFRHTGDSFEKVKTFLQEMSV